MGLERPHHKIKAEPAPARVFLEKVLQYQSVHQDAVMPLSILNRLLSESGLLRSPNLNRGEQEKSRLSRESSLVPDQTDFQFLKLPTALPLHQSLKHK